MMRCRTCLYTSLKPDLHFDETGQCSACRSVEEKTEIDWAARSSLLMELLDRHHGDVIVPSSGGKDSHFQALFLKEIGANVTAVTARTCHLTPIGRENIDNLARHVRTIEVVPNMTVRAKLNRLGLEMVGDISWPEHAAIFSTPLRVAADIGVKLVMYGECPQREYGGPQGSAEAKQMTNRWISEFGGFLGLRPEDLIGTDGITETDMADYQPPDLAGAGIEAHFLGAYTSWDSRYNANYAKEFGMKTLGAPPCRANWWDFENLDNAQTGIHDYGMYLKYGYGRGAAQLSIDVRAGTISLEEAISKADKIEGKFPLLYAGVPVEDVLDRIGMSFERLTETLSGFSSIPQA